MKLPVYKQRRGHTADHKDREHLDALPAIGSDISDTKGDPAKGKNTDHKRPNIEFLSGFKYIIEGKHGQIKETIMSPMEIRKCSSVISFFSLFFQFRKKRRLSDLRSCLLTSILLSLLLPLSEYMPPAHPPAPETLR